MSRHRLAQVNAAVVPAQYSTLQAFADKRAKQFGALSKDELDLHDHLVKEFGIDERKQVYLLIVEPSKDRGAMYSGCSPFCVIRGDIGTAFKAKEIAVCLYLSPTNRLSYPVFTVEDYSSLRCLKYDETTKKLDQYARTVRDFSIYELLESAFGILSGTLFAFMTSTQNVGRREMNLVSVFLLSINNTIGDNKLFWNSVADWNKPLLSDEKNEQKSKSPLIECQKPEIEALIQELLNRDTNENFANRIRKIKDVNEIRKFYHLLTLAATENPAVLHQSVWPRLEYYLFSLLFFSEDESTVSSIRDRVLQSTFNRLLRSFPKFGNQLKLILTKEELIEHVLTFSPRLVNQLRYWAFMTQYCLLVNRNKSKCLATSFFEQVDCIRQNVLSCPSMPVLCTLISSEAKSWTAEVIADLLLATTTIAADEKRFATIRPDFGCATLTKVLHANITEHQRVRQEVESLCQKDQDKEQDKPAASNDDVIALAKQACPLRHDKSNAVEFIVKHAAGGDSYCLQILRGLALSHVLSKARFMKIVLWTSSLNSKVHKYYKDLVGPGYYENLMANARDLGGGCHYEHQLIKKYRKSNVEIQPIVELEVHEKLNGVPVQIIPFEPSCLTLHRILQKSTGECAICFSGKGKLVKLHETKENSIWHATCRDCQIKIKAGDNPVCPFCRSKLD